MDDATKKMLVTVVAPILRKGLITVGTALSTHGILASNQIETFVSIGLTLIGLGWSFWNDYGRAIVLSQLDVLKAKSLAQAVALRDGGIKAPDAQAIAAASAKSPEVATLTVEEVKKAAATLPVAVAGTTALLALFFVALTIATPAAAQGPIARKIQQDVTSKITGQPAPGAGGALHNILGAFDDVLLEDLRFAKNIADKSGNTLTSDCWAAWIDRIEARRNANLGPDGQPLEPPNPRVITDFQKLMDLRRSLDPGSNFMKACLPVAAQVKKDIQGLIGAVLGGGAGLAALVPGL